MENSARVVLLRIMVGDVHSSLLLGRVLRIRLGGKLGRLMVQILLSRQVVVVETSIA